MPSKSLEQWRTVRLAELDELEAAHRGIGGSGRGRRYATQQINYAYAVLLSAQFQGFCRDLHAECADHFVQSLSPGPLKRALLNGLVQNRKLDRGNPSPSHIGADYNKFELGFWPEVKLRSPRNGDAQTRLELLNEWRNAIAHQDFASAKFGQGALHLKTIRQWRKACDRLAGEFDEVMRLHLNTVNGASPW